MDFVAALMDLVAADLLSLEPVAMVYLIYSDLSFLEPKASKGIHQVCIEKSPDRHLSIHAMKIVPLVVQVYTVGFVKCFGIAVFCFILNQSGEM